MQKYHFYYQIATKVNIIFRINEHIISKLTEYMFSKQLTENCKNPSIKYLKIIPKKSFPEMKS